jgi:drug/metabolite transporter (DMT)-like permease
MADRGAVRKRNTLYGLAAIVLWSTTVALARSLSKQVGPLTAAAAVYLVGGLLSVAWAAIRDPGCLRTMLRLRPAYLAGCGGLFVFYTGALFLALGLAADDDQAIAIGLVNYLWPALTIVFSLPLLSHRGRWGLIPGTLLALSGAGLALTSGRAFSWAALWTATSGNPRSFTLALAAAVAWALYSNLARRWTRPGDGGAVPAFILVSGGALFGMRLLLPERGTWTAVSLAEAVFMGLTVVVAYTCWEAAMRRGDAVLVTACSYLTPLLAAFVSCVYLHAAPGPALWIGCFCIVAGAMLSWRSVEDRVPPDGAASMP